jgi:hypothetical protein
MRRLVRTIASILVAGSIAVSAATPVSASPVRREYRGETTQGERIVFKTAEYVNGRVRLTYFEIGTMLTCDDETTHHAGWGYHYGRSGPLLADGTTLDVDEGDVQLAIHIDGELRRRQGSGTLKVTWAALTDDEQAQICTTGDLMWDVLREVG